MKKLINALTKAFGGHSKTSEDYYNQGNAKCRIQNYREAIDDYTKAIELNPEFVMAYNNRGNAKIAIEDYRGGVDDLTKAIEINPNHAEAYYNRGVIKSYYLGQKDSGRMDLIIAGDLGITPADEAIKTFCQ